MPASQVDDETRAFIIEHFIYVAVLSDISLGVESYKWVLEDAMLLIPMISKSEHKATGMFCGAAHDLFQLIPQVTVFSRKLIKEQDESTELSSETLSTYKSLRSSIITWRSTSSNEGFTISGKIYQQALLVYLEASMSRIEQSGPISTTAAASREEAIDTATTLLESLPLDTDIATTLCWPIAIIGSCATLPRHQQTITQRLKLMHCMLGFGNLSTTQRLLRTIWADNSSGRAGPWSIEPLMRKEGEIIAFL